ncbi:hypothetical protein OAA09_00160 [bacterium]|nr:hypothetical protein [bacterium]
MILSLILFLGLASAESESSIVYVAPPTIKNSSSQVNLTIDDNAVFFMATAHSKNAKEKNLKIFSKDTINYQFGEKCNYTVDAKKCSYQNSHYHQETIITVTDAQIIVDMLLYDPKLQVVARGTKSTTSHIVWIKQQEVTIQQKTTMMGSTTTVHKGKEDIPLKWIIPYRFLSRQLYQASLGLWIGADIK